METAARDGQRVRVALAVTPRLVICTYIEHEPIFYCDWKADGAA